MNFKRLANALGLVVLLALVVPFVIYAVPGMIGAEYSFVVLSGSMAPAIDPGDVVIVGERDLATIEEGDVITFVRGDAETPVTHRVIGIEERDAAPTFETKGDANAEVDASPVPASNVLGVVVLTIPYIGYVIQAADGPVGFALLVVVPLALFVASELWTLFRTSRATDSQRGDPAGGPDSPVETGGESAAVGEPGTITFSATDLSFSAGILALVSPYTIYVALELRTALAISVAFAATFSLVAVGGLWLTARSAGTRVGDDGEEDASDDGEDDASDDTSRAIDKPRESTHSSSPGLESSAADPTVGPFDGFEPATESIDPATDGGRSAGETE